MCYAIPGRIRAIDGDDAVIDYSGVRKKANISLLERPNVGDFVLVHAGFAIQKVDPDRAKESLEVIKDLD